MLLTNQSPLDSLLSKEYQGKAIELMPSYMHKSILLKMRHNLGERLKLVTGPLYYGEAEINLLVPLLEALRDSASKRSQGTIAAHAYQLSAAFALIHDITKISQSRDIANQMTLTSVMAQPIVKRFIALAPKTEEPKGENLTEEKKNLATLWTAIKKMGDGNFTYEAPQHNDLTYTPLSVLYQSTNSLGTTVNDVKTTFSPTVVNVWSRLLSTLRHGKGVPLERSGRKDLMALITEILLRIDAIIGQVSNVDALLQTPMNETEWNTQTKKYSLNLTAFQDAYTAMFWLEEYLNVVEQYDVIFPASDLMVQTQAWVLVIKTFAAKMKKCFAEIAQVSISYDISLAMALWDEVRNFWNPVLNKNLSAVSDLDTIWNSCKELASKLLSSYASSQVSTTFSGLKKYMEADYVLPSSEFSFASDVLDDYQMPMQDKGVYHVRTGEAVLTTLDSVGERPTTQFDRDLLIPKLAQSAGYVEAALACVRRSREILQLTEMTDDIYHSLLPEGMSWLNPYSLTGSIKDLNPAQFTYRDPMELSYEKYEAQKTDATINSLDWRFTSLLMVPFYRIPQLQKFAEDRSSSSRVIWPAVPELPVGDVITAEYVRQPLPASYTCTRNANFVANSWQAYMTLMMGHSGIASSSRDMFRKIASVLEKYPDTYGKNILDALAATMFVYKKGAKDADVWTLQRPSLPAIYGAPLQAMIDANPASNREKEGPAANECIITINGGAKYKFALHKKVPTPGPYVYISYPYTTGAFLQVPILKVVYDALEQEILTTMKISLTEGDNVNVQDISGYNGVLTDLATLINKKGAASIEGLEFQASYGWAPFLSVMPHLLCAYQDKDDKLNSDEYKKYALLSVRVRYDLAEKLVYVGGFVDNPVELITVEEYMTETSKEDPSPLVNGSVVKDPDPNPDLKEPVRSEAAPNPTPETLGAEKRDENGQPVPGDKQKAAANVTSGPLMGPGAALKPAIPDTMKAGDSVGRSSEPVDALRGTPAPEVGNQEPDSDGKPSDKYWKKVASDGTVEDVVQAKSCPAGYVPASADDYAEFVKKAVKAEKDTKEEGER